MCIIVIVESQLLIDGVCIEPRDTREEYLIRSEHYENASCGVPNKMLPDAETTYGTKSLALAADESVIPPPPTVS